MDCPFRIATQQWYTNVEAVSGQLRRDLFRGAQSGVGRFMNPPWRDTSRVLSRNFVTFVRPEFSPNRDSENEWAPAERQWPTFWGAGSASDFGIDDATRERSSVTRRSGFRVHPQKPPHETELPEQLVAFSSALGRTNEAQIANRCGTERRLGTVTFQHGRKGRSAEVATAQFFDHNEKLDAWWLKNCQATNKHLGFHGDVNHSSASSGLVQERMRRTR